MHDLFGLSAGPDPRSGWVACAEILVESQASRSMRTTGQIPAKVLKERNVVRCDWLAEGLDLPASMAYAVPDIKEPMEPLESPTSEEL
jgi:hypothetical protein